MLKSSHRKIRPHPDVTLNPHIRAPDLASSQFRAQIGSETYQTQQTQLQLTQGWASVATLTPSWHNSHRFGSSGESADSEIFAELHSGEQNRTHLQRVPQRRSHNKSRSGCNTCKARRIKACDENHPTCIQCNKRQLVCTWPRLPNRNPGSARESVFSSSPVLLPLQSPHATFTMQDFRLFYHFIQSAYPHQPIGNDSVWTHEIPSISHNYDFLMHAMLALSASNITMSSARATDLTCAAISHRVRAISAFNQALSNGLQTAEEGNAMLATSYVLLFQSVLIEDGLSEFMSFFRGILLIAKNMGCKSMNFVFHNFLGVEQFAQMEPHLEGPPNLSPAYIDGACKSLDAIAPLCRPNYEQTFHKALVKTAHALYTSSREAYTGLREIYVVFGFLMTHEEFRDYINPENEIGQLLQSHFVALQFILSPITVNEMGDRKLSTPTYDSGRWLNTIHARIPRHMQKYYIWPISIAEAINDESFFKELWESSRTMSPENKDIIKTRMEAAPSEDSTI